LSFYFLELDSLSRKRRRSNVTCLLDLPTEVFFLIYRYLSCADALYSFHTTQIVEDRLHRVIGDYYRKIKLDKVTDNEFLHLSYLFCHSKLPLRPKSLILSNEHIPNLIQRFLIDININTINSIFINLKSLTLINCTLNQFDVLNQVFLNMKLIEYLHIIFARIDDDDDDDIRKYDKVSSIQ
jgi:hypothetical protein